MQNRVFIIIHSPYFCRLSLHELQTLLEENDHEVQQNIDVYLGIPDDIGEDTEEDSDSSDDEHIGDVNRLCRGILQQDCEVRARKQNDFDEEDLVPLAQLFPKSRSSSHQTCEARPNEQDDFDEEDTFSRSGY